MHYYEHTVQYYETDKMKITHHSNYIRWMEEARIDWLESLGWGFDKLESLGMISPVVEIKCKYVIPTTFHDIVTIGVKLKEYKGVKLIIEYEMKNKATGKIVAIGESVHCFTNEEGKPIMIKKQCPGFDEALTKEMKNMKKEG